MGINCSTPFKCLSCNLDCKEQTNFCLYAYRDVKLLASKKEDLVAEMYGHKDKYCTTDALDVWMEKVENLHVEIESILDKQHKNCCFCYQRYMFGYVVAEKLNLVKDLHVRLENLHKARMIVEKVDIEQLRIGIDNVLARKVDLENHLAHENRFQYCEFTEVVQKWMAEVHELSERGTAILRKVIVDEANRAPDHQIGEGVYELCCIIEKLQEQRKGWDDKNILVKKPLSVVEECFWYSPQLIDVDLKVKEILNHLSGDEFSIIRIFGAGGIGKTTLLTEINNTFYNDKSKNSFSRVIYVTVTQTWSISKIQQEIASRLGVSTGKEFSEANEEENARAIFDAFGRDSFLLLLDDVWEDLDFKKIGIRPPVKSPKNSKIVLTSRFANSCSSVGVDKTIRMEYLDEEASWKLFFEACGGEWNQALRQSSIQKVAKDVVKLCGGLPLALTVIGRAVACLERLDDWKEAKQQLIESTGGDKIEPILQRLRYSFDRLKDEVTKSCFLFCLLFGQGGYMNEDELVDYWIGEGLLLDDKYSTLRSLRSKGREVVRTLVQACLLQKVGERENDLRMHDMIYSMAMWIESEKGGPKTLIIRDGNTRPLEKAGRAMIGGTRETWTCVMESVKLCCPSLTTLSWEGSEIHSDEVGDGFFDQMPSVRVLYLSYFRSSHLPSSICSLVWLRSLSLRYSSIEELPVEFGRLVNLLLLDLSATSLLENIPKEAVAPLVNLLSLNMHSSGYTLTSEEGQFGVHDLNELPRLEEFMVPHVRSVEPLRLLSTLPRLSSLIRKLDLQFVHFNMTLFHVLEHFRNLESLGISYCSIEEGTLAGSRYLGASGNRLCILRIFRCSIISLSWLLCRLPNLEQLEVSCCYRLEKLYCVQADDGAPSSMNCLSKLKTMSLLRLPELSSIAGGQLAFSSLVELKVIRCPKLRKLAFPFVERNQNIRIDCAFHQWKDFEWDDDGSKSMFTPIDPWDRPL